MQPGSFTPIGFGELFLAPRAVPLGGGWPVESPAADLCTPAGQVGKPACSAGFDGMLWFFGVFGLVAFAFVALLWLRESGPLGRGLESGRARL
jgi:hypothetical protein